MTCEALVITGPTGPTGAGAPGATGPTGPSSSMFRKGSAVVAAGTGSIGVTFDEAFPTACDGVFVTNTSNGITGWVSAKSASGFTLQGGAATASDYDYLAVGH